MRMSAWWPGVAGLAEGQSGLFTAAQAQAAGATRPQLGVLVGDGSISRLQHGVYEVAGAPSDRWTPARAAWLGFEPASSAEERLRRADPAGVLSHRSAARLLALGDVDDPLIEFSDGVRRRTRNVEVVVHRGLIPPGDWTVVAGLPVTTPAATIGSLAESGTDLGHLADAVRDAMLHHGVSQIDLSFRLDPIAERYGFASGEDFVDALLSQSSVPAQVVDLTAGVAGAELLRAIGQQSGVQSVAERAAKSIQMSPEFREVLTMVTGRSLVPAVTESMSAVAEASPGVVARMGADLAMVMEPVQEQFTANLARALEDSGVMAQLETLMARSITPALAEAAVAGLRRADIGEGRRDD